MVGKIKAQLDEEARIKALNGGTDATQTTPGGTPVVPLGAVSEGKIEVDKETLLELIKSNKEMAKSIEQLQSNAAATSGMGNNGPMVLRKNRDSVMRIMKWNDKYVLGFKNMGKPTKPLYVYKEYNAQTRENIEFVNIVLEGEVEAEKVQYVEFLREAERVEVKKLKQVEHEDIKEQGMVYKKDFAENGYGMFETMVQVPVEIITKTYTYTVQLPAEDGGRELEIEGQWVNN